MGEGRERSAVGSNYSCAASAFSTAKQRRSSGRWWKDICAVGTQHDHNAADAVEYRNAIHACSVGFRRYARSDRTSDSSSRVYDGSMGKQSAPESDWRRIDSSSLGEERQCKIVEPLLVQSKHERPAMYGCIDMIDILAVCDSRTA